MGATYWHRRASLDMGNRGVQEGHAMVGSLGLGSSWQRVRLLRLTKKRDQTVEQLDTRCAKRGPSSHRFLQPFQHTVPTFDNLHRWEGRPQRPSFPTIPRIEPCLSWTEPEPSPYPAILRSLSSSTVNHLIASIHGPSQVRTRPRTALRWCLEKITCIDTTTIILKVQHSPAHLQQTHTHHADTTPTKTSTPSRLPSRSISSISRNTPCVSPLSSQSSPPSARNTNPSHSHPVRCNSFSSPSILNSPASTCVSPCTTVPSSPYVATVTPAMVERPYDNSGSKSGSCRVISPLAPSALAKNRTSLITWSKPRVDT
ncbi:hypothetical protein B5807_09240 [Epicoccum nigrum]|uniref:Uncharacterized protein n=1 Tax=Epicoccum nigrum TaxID=105696 RepID=A0A1Y2LPW3_EPING|nr:hypothetical protein B5807_09240 [Epicoccum nigrum]